MLSGAVTTEEVHMRIFKTLYFYLDAEPGHVFSCDTIELQGSMWLVPAWTVNFTTAMMRPERIICLDHLPHQKTSQNHPAHFVVNIPIPKCVFDGEIPPETSYKFEIVENPVIEMHDQEQLH